MNRAADTALIARLIKLNIAFLEDHQRVTAHHTDLCPLCIKANALLAATGADAVAARDAQSLAGMSESKAFKYMLDELSTGNPNPKERRRLAREVRSSIKACADALRERAEDEIADCGWIKPGDRLPLPYEEVRILFDGVPRIARLCHSRDYFQLATFIDSTKSQYIAPLAKVTGWMPLPLATQLTAAGAA